MVMRPLEFCFLCLFSGVSWCPGWGWGTSSLPLDDLGELSRYSKCLLQATALSCHFEERQGPHSKDPIFRPLLSKILASAFCMAPTFPSWVDIGIIPGSQARDEETQVLEKRDYPIAVSKG